MSVGFLITMDIKIMSIGCINPAGNCMFKVNLIETLEQRVKYVQI